MRNIAANAWIVGIASIALFAVGCGTNSDTAGPASQGQVNDLTKKLEKTQSSTPDVPIELRNKGVGAGTGIRKGGG